LLSSGSSCRIRTLLGSERTNACRDI
jgi:hypothetical protein